MGMMHGPGLVVACFFQKREREREITELRALLV